MFVFEKSGEITPNDDKTNIIISFDVPENIEKMSIDYAYSPKIAENTEKAIDIINDALEKYSASGDPQEYLPVKNLITLSLDDSLGYRGAAHRQAECQHHEISNDFASPGFVKGEICTGKWQIMLNVHCCVCNVSYDIKISGEEKK